MAWQAWSTDFSPCDFWLWGIVKERVYAMRLADIDDLQRRITTVVCSMPTEMCERAMACMDFRSVLAFFDIIFLCHYVFKIHVFPGSGSTYLDNLVYVT